MWQNVLPGHASLLDRGKPWSSREEQSWRQKRECDCREPSWRPSWKLSQMACSDNVQRQWHASQDCYRRLGMAGNWRGRQGPAGWAVGAWSCGAGVPAALRCQYSMSGKRELASASWMTTPLASASLGWDGKGDYTLTIKINQLRAQGHCFTSPDANGAASSNADMLQPFTLVLPPRLPNSLKVGLHHHTG